MNIDPQLQRDLMIFGGFVPGTIALVALLAGWYVHAYRASRVDHIDHHDSEDDEAVERSAGPRWLLPMLLLLGFAGAHHAADSTFHLWPDSNSARFVHALGLIALVGVLEGLVRLPMLLAFVFRLLGYGGAFWMLSEGYTGSVFGDSVTLVGSAGFVALAGALVASACDRTSDQTPGWVDAGSWLLVFAGSMPIFLHNHFATGAMIPAGVISVLVSAMIVGLVFRSLRFSRGAVTVLVGALLVMLTGSIIQTGVVFLPAVMILALSPMALLVPTKGMSGGRQLLVRVVMLAMILGSSAGLMLWASDADASENEVDPYADYEPEL